MDPAIANSHEWLTAAGLFAALVIGLPVALLWWPVFAVLVFTLSILQVHLGLDLHLAFASFNVDPMDVVAVVMLSAAAIRIPLRGRPDVVELWLLALLAALSLAALRGAAAYGLTTAMVPFRANLYLVASMVYIMTFEADDRGLDRFAWMALAFALGLVVYAIACWLDPSLMPAGWAQLQRILPGHYFLRWRVLPASSALLLAEAALVALALWTRPAGFQWAKPLVMIFIPTVALLYHRSVWVAFIVASLAMLGPTQLRRLVVPGILVAIVAGALWLFGADQLSRAMSSAVLEPFDRQSTWAWRTQNWKVMVPETLAAGPLTVLFGQGYGRVFTMAANGTVLASAHNAFVETFVSAGLFGLVAYTGALASMVLRLLRAPEIGGDLLNRRTALALLTALIVYSVPYAPGGEQGLVLGMLAAFCARCAAEAAAAPAATAPALAARTPRLLADG
jgi:hypothetical protein